MESESEVLMIKVTARPGGTDLFWEVVHSMKMAGSQCLLKLHSDIGKELGTLYHQFNMHCFLTVWLDFYTYQYHNIYQSTE